MDEVWVPSSWGAKVFEKAGVNPSKIQVIPGEDVRAYANRNIVLFRIHRRASVRLQASKKHRQPAVPSRYVSLTAEHAVTAWQDLRATTHSSACSSGKIAK